MWLLIHAGIKVSVHDLQMSCSGLNSVMEWENNSPSLASHKPTCPTNMATNSSEVKGQWPWRPIWSRRSGVNRPCTRITIVLPVQVAPSGHFPRLPRWRHDMETPSPLLALCEENPPVTGVFSHKGKVMRCPDVFFAVITKKCPLLLARINCWTC